jgi:macrodomain Ter protein organizer (MatP/YcbG family)
MAASNGRGVPNLLIRPTSPAPQATEAEASQGELEEPVEQADQGRGDQRTSAAPKARRRRPSAPVEKTSKRGVYLSDAVWERLQLEAIRKKTTVSAIANDVLDRNLLRLRIERDA